MKTYTITYSVRANGKWSNATATVDRDTFYSAYVGYRRSGFHYIYRFNYHDSWRSKYSGEKVAVGNITLVHDEMVLRFEVRESVDYNKAI